jgi:23S rRNA (guanosine2251-2'-O)-methyltransferase
VGEALTAGLPLSRLLVADSEGDTRLARLVSRAEAAGVAVERVPRSQLDALSSHGAHQGVMAKAAPFRYTELADIISAAGNGPALVVVLDHVTDEGNFGAIVRSAEVVGAAGVVIPKARSVSVGAAAYKTSAGAVLHMPVAQVPNLANALDQLKDAGFWAGGATEHADQVVWEAPLEGRVALVMGSEGEGISRLVLEHCDFTCRLPQRGRVESLNVAQAATVLSYEWMRRTFADEGGAHL